MDLQQRLQSFLDWMRSHALPGFMAYTEENDSEDDVSLKVVLLEIAQDIKNAVANNDVPEYEENEELYKLYFRAINEDIAMNHYDDLLDDFLDSGLDPLSAKTMAVEELWKNPLYREYLNISVELISTKGERLYLVGKAEDAEGKHPYVLPNEIEMLKNSFQDPWEYVRNRETPAHARGF